MNAADIIAKLKELKVPQELLQDIERTYKERDEAYAMIEGLCRAFNQLAAEHEIYKSINPDGSMTADMLIRSDLLTEHNFFALMSSLARDSQLLSRLFGKKKHEHTGSSTQGQGKGKGKKDKGKGKNQNQGQNGSGSEEFSSDELAALMEQIAQGLPELNNPSVTAAYIQKMMRQADALHKHGYITEEEWKAVKSDLSVAMAEKDIDRAHKALTSAASYMQRAAAGNFRHGSPHQPKEQDSPDRDADHSPEAPSADPQPDLTASIAEQVCYGSRGRDYLEQYQFTGTDQVLMSGISYVLQKCGSSTSPVWFTADNYASKQIMTENAALQAADPSRSLKDKTELTELLTTSALFYPELPDQAFCPQCRQLQPIELAGGKWARLQACQAELNLISDCYQYIPKCRCRECGTVFELTLLNAEQVNVQLPIGTGEVMQSMQRLLAKQSPVSGGAAIESSSCRDGTVELTITQPASDWPADADAEADKTKSAPEPKNVVLVGKGTNLTAEGLDTLRLDRLSVINLLPPGFNLQAAGGRPVYKGSKFTISAAAAAMDLCLLWNVAQNRVCSKQDISNGTFFPMFASLSRTVMQPLAEDIYHSILHGVTVMCDESGFLCIESTKKPDGCKVQTVVVMNHGPLSEDRSCCYIPIEHKTEAEMLRLLSGSGKGGFSYQYLHTDNLRLYHNIAEELHVTHAVCLSHARRQVMEVILERGLEQVYDELMQTGGCRGFAAAAADYFTPKPGDDPELCEDNKYLLLLLHLFNAVFGVEHETSVYNPDYVQEITKLRREKSQEMAAQMKLIIDILVKRHCTFSAEARGRRGMYSGRRGSLIGRAAAYLWNDWEAIILFTKHPELAPSTNSTELLLQDALARQRDFKRFNFTWEGARSYWASMTVARSCYFNGVSFTDYTVWVFNEMVKRLQHLHPGQVPYFLRPQLMRLDELDAEHQQFYRERHAITKKAIKESNGVEFAVVKLYDDLYQAPFDDLDLTGLSVMDYKKLCLGGAALTWEQAEAIQDKLAEKQNKVKEDHAAREEEYQAES